MRESGFGASQPQLGMAELFITPAFKHIEVIQAENTVIFSSQARNTCTAISSTYKGGFTFSVIYLCVISYFRSYVYIAQMYTHLSLC